MNWRKHLATLRKDERGISAVEFAMVAPVFLALVMGAVQFSIDIYMKSILTGAVQQAGRDSGLEGANTSQTAIDEKVRKQITAILPTATVEFTRKNYQSFTDVGKKEEFEDKARSGVKDGIKQNDECYWDENDSNTWDDGAVSGQGDAQDIVVYTATAKYNELLPLKALIGLGDTRALSASTTLMNQPFAYQKPRPPAVKKGTC